MGGIYSVYNNWADEPENQKESTKYTPTQPLKRKRLVSNDPRSPSAGIDRTPILVDRTPRSLQVLQTTAQGAAALLKDPRSPTYEFLRTPIPSNNTGVRQQEIDRVAQPQLERADLNNSIHSQHQSSESGIESAEVTPVLGRGNRLIVASPDMLDSPDSVISEGESEDHSGAMSDLSDLCPMVVSPDPMTPCSETGEESDGTDIVNQMYDDKLVAVDVQGVGSTVSRVPSATDFTPKLTPVNRLHARLGKKSENIWSAGLTRSPLTAVANSPGLSSNRQAGKPGLPVTSTVVHVDKENIYH